MADVEQICPHMPQVSLHWFQQKVRYGDLLRHLVFRCSFDIRPPEVFFWDDGFGSGDSGLGISSPTTY